ATLAAPGAAWAEKEGTFTNGRGTTQRFHFARPTPGQARPELELLHALLARAGKAAGAYSPRRIFDELAKAVAGFEGLTWDGLAPRGPVWGPHMAAVAKDGGSRHQGVSPTPAAALAGAAPSDVKAR